MSSSIRVYSDQVAAGWLLIFFCSIICSVEFQSFLIQWLLSGCSFSFVQLPPIWSTFLYVAAENLVAAVRQYFFLPVGQGWIELGWLLKSGCWNTIAKFVHVFGNLRLYSGSQCRHGLTEFLCFAFLSWTWKFVRSSTTDTLLKLALFFSLNKFW